MLLKNTCIKVVFLKSALPSLPTSINRIYNELKSQGVSIGKNTLYDVIVQTESIYLFFSLTKYEPSLVKESSGDKKYYCIDNGLRSVLLNPQSEGNGKLLENTVYLHLRRNLPVQGGLHYYKGKKECDFVITEHEEVIHLIQVTYTLHDEDTRQREIDGLLEAAQVTGCRELFILTFEEEEEMNVENSIFHSQVERVITNFQTAKHSLTFFPLIL